MIRTLIGAAVAAAMLALPASAADIPRAAVPAIPVKAPLLAAGAASGLYFGGFVGGGMTKENFEFVTIPGSGSLYPTGIQFGAKIGYAAWLGSVMLGLEADIAYDVNRSQTNTCGIAMICESKGSWLLTQRAVFGWVMGSGARAAGATPDQWPVPLQVPSTFTEARIVPYITGGVAERRIKMNVVSVGSAEEWLVGYAAGGGVRIPVSQAISLDISYLYIGYNRNFIPATSVPIFPTFKAQSEQVGRLGLTYGF